LTDLTFQFNKITKLLTLFTYHGIYTIHQQDSNNIMISPKHHVQSINHEKYFVVN